MLFNSSDIAANTREWDLYHHLLVLDVKSSEIRVRCAPSSKRGMATSILNPKGPLFSWPPSLLAPAFQQWTSVILFEHHLAKEYGLRQCIEAAKIVGVSLLIAGAQGAEKIRFHAYLTEKCVSLDATWWE
jgi:hypothetical protein